MSWDYFVFDLGNAFKASSLIEEECKIIMDEKPLLQIGSTVLMGEKKEALGTDLVFENNDFQMEIKERYQFKRVSLVPK